MNTGIESVAAARDRRYESALAWCSLAALTIYAPVETWVSRPHLTSPGYIVDVIAFGLLLYSGVHSLRRRPRRSVGPLCGAWGFCACLAWRCYFMRVFSRQRGLGIYPDEPLHETALSVVLVIALAAFATSLYLAHRQDRAPRDAAP